MGISHFIVRFGASVEEDNFIVAQFSVLLVRIPIAPGCNEEKNLDLEN